MWCEEECGVGAKSVCEHRTVLVNNFTLNKKKKW